MSSRTVIVNRPARVISREAKSIVKSLPYILPLVGPFPFPSPYFHISEKHPSVVSQDQQLLQYLTMPPRSLSERSPVSVMRWDDSSTISSMDNMKSGKPPLAKGIRFAEKNEIFHIQHLDDMTDEEVFNIWYTSKEYSEIKQAYQVTIFMMESGETITGDEHTSRGLEYRTQEGAWARYENKRDAYNAVLDEQDRQWKVDKDDYEKIRQIYLKHSTKCANAAIVRALQDERDIKEFTAEEEAATKVKKTKKVKKIVIVKKKKVKDSESKSSDGKSEKKRGLVRKEGSKTPGKVSSSQ